VSAVQVPHVGPHLAKPHNMAKETLSDSSRGLEQAPKVRFSRSSTPFASIRPLFCRGRRLREFRNVAGCVLTHFPATQSIVFTRSGPYTVQILYSLSGDENENYTGVVSPGYHALVVFQKWRSIAINATLGLR
jgi:hypothetical protein